MSTIIRNVVACVGTGPTVNAAISDADNEFDDLAAGLDDTVVFVGVSAQTFWDDREQVFYHIITTAWHTRRAGAT